jgi:hypothetical protein
MGFDPRPEQSNFLVASTLIPALVSTQSPVQGTGVFSPGVERGWGVALSAVPLLVPRTRKSWSCTSILPKRHHDMQRDSAYEVFRPL